LVALPFHVLCNPRNFVLYIAYLWVYYG
jgi:hypothetical protein